MIRPLVIDEDEVYQAMCDLTEIKNHLKEHFDLWGDNQPWHLFDKLHLDLSQIAWKISQSNEDEDESMEEAIGDGSQ